MYSAPECTTETLCDFAKSAISASVNFCRSDSRREVFRGDYDRYGQGALPEAMAAYGDNRSSDRLIERCMEQRGYPAPQKAWWQKIGS